mgnify:CR=1 FL=1
MVITSFTTLGNGISNYTSQNMGAGKMDRVHKGFGAGRNLVWIICVPIVLLYFFFGRFLLLLFMNDPQGPAIDTGCCFCASSLPSTLWCRSSWSLTASCAAAA